MDVVDKGAAAAVAAISLGAPEAAVAAPAVADGGDAVVAGLLLPCRPLGSPQPSPVYRG